MTRAEMARLAWLEEEHYDRKTWVALVYARDWALGCGSVTNTDLVEEYESLYTEQERADILATLIGMNFFNRFMNTLTGRVLDQERACAVDL